jgi:hypothetical protein
MVRVAALGERLTSRQTRLTETFVRGANETQNSPVPTALDNGRRSPKELLRAVVARLLGRKA